MAVFPYNLSLMAGSILASMMGILQPYIQNPL